jgi:hypothetical protein
MPDKDFGELFEEAANEDGKKTEDTKTSDSKDVKDDKVEEKVDDKIEDEDGKKTDEVAKTKDDESSKKKTGDSVDKKPTYEEIEQKYKSLQGMIEHEQKEKSEIAKKAKELEDKLSAVERISEIKPKSDEEDKDADLEEYLKDYAFISANEAKLRKKELEKLKKDIVKEVADAYEIPIKTVEKLVQEDAEVKAAVHLGAIREAHEDYGVTVKKMDIVQWVETLSPSKRKAGMTIITEGDTDEVIDLITDYKKAHDMIPKEDDPNGVSKSEDKKKLKDDRLESLESIKGKKSPVTGGGKGKAESFEDAFAEAASAK